MRRKRFGKAWVWCLIGVCVPGVVVVAAFYVASNLLTQDTQVLVTPYDILTAPDTAVPLRVKLQRGIVLRDAAEEPVRFTLPDGRTFAADTDEQGEATAQATFDEPGDYTVAIEVPAKFHAIGTAADGSGLALVVFVRAADQKIAVCDVDHTLADISAALVMQTANERTPALPGSADVLTRLAETHTIVYLTARDDKLLNKTRSWLTLKGYPAGPLYGRDLGHDSLSAEKFKTKWLQELTAKWPGVAVGFGDRIEDARAYDAAGIASHIVHAEPFAEGALPASAHRAADWEAIRAKLRGPAK